LNDPSGTLPWPATRPARGEPAAADADLADDQQYGGDLQGLQEKLPYLKDLGIKALYLTSIFHSRQGSKGSAVDLRHIDDALGVKDSLAKLAEEKPDPKTWKLSASDHLFLGFLKEAHKKGFHVVVEAAFGKVQPAFGEGANAEKHLLEITLRWMDPNGDNDPSDGVDGWVLSEPGRQPHAFWKRWRTHAKKINPEALLIGDIRGDARPWLAGDQFDTAINRDFASAVERFWGRRSEAYGLERFLADVTAISRRHAQNIQLAAPVPLSNSDMGRLLSALSRRRPDTANEGAAAAPATDPRSEPSRWRFAAMMQCFFPGAPMTYYGDEVGMYNTTGHFSRAPMWWEDSASGASKLAVYQNDFTSLIQWLNLRRDTYPPLQTGSFRAVLADEKRGLLAVGRTLPGYEVILLINYGDAKHKVMLQAGKPGQLVGVLGPRLGATPRKKRSKATPGPKDGRIIQPLGVGGSRRFVDAKGRIRLWLNPMSVRVVLVRDDPPW
jgi:glycosidase